tara:strand:+ start:960 stop:1151 length:192 start_codon:yes stop_codon:yes gene_type:complete
MPTKYKVLNPRNIPEGVRIIADKRGREWYEGDDFEPPAYMGSEDIEWLRAQGLIAPVIGGASG